MNVEAEDSEDKKLLKNCSCELGVLSQCDGSAMLCNGPAAVLAGAFGPVESRPGRELVDRAVIEVSFRGNTGVEGVEHRRVEQLVRATLEECVYTTLHPRTCVSVSLNVLETDPVLLLSTCINAACLALLDAAVPMKFVPAALTCVPRGDRILVNPLPDQLQGADTPLSSATVVLNPSSGHLVSSTTSGRLSPAELSSCLREARQAAVLVTSFYRSAVRAKLCKEPREPWTGPVRAEDTPSAHLQRPGARKAAAEAEAEA